MIELLSIIMLIFGILQIILFFKIWRMTNDVHSMKEKSIENNTEIGCYIKSINEHLRKIENAIINKQCNNKE